MAIVKDCTHESDLGSVQQCVLTSLSLWFFVGHRLLGSELHTMAHKQLYYQRANSFRLLNKIL